MHSGISAGFSPEKEPIDYQVMVNMVRAHVAALCHSPNPATRKLNGTIKFTARRHGFL
jgi:hypothetical protein